MFCLVLSISNSSTNIYEHVQYIFVINDKFLLEYHLKP